MRGLRLPKVLLWAPWSMVCQLHSCRTYSDRAIELACTKTSASLNCLRPMCRLHCRQMHQINQTGTGLARGLLCQLCSLQLALP